MADTNLQSLNPETGAPPERRVLNAASLNQVVKKIMELDAGSALSRQDVQKMLDGGPPFDPAFMRESGQEGRCNLNFGDAKAMLKAEMAGYYDLTDSVPTLAMVLTDYGQVDDPQRTYYNAVMSEEFHRLLKDWKQFDTKHQLLVQRFCSHGLGFLYFKDSVDWRWECAGLEDFKLPRGTTMDEDEIDIACVFREVTIGKLWSWIKDVSPDDKRWNQEQVKQAILTAADSSITAFSDGAWEKWQSMLKNNDLYASSTAQETVKLAHAWVKEFNGKVSHYLTLRNGTNTDYLYKCEGLFDCVNQCFTFFPYEVGTNGLLHSVRGKGHEIYATVQVLNSLRCQVVDNAKLSGSLLLQPATATDAEDMAILFYAGAAYIPPGLKVQNTQLSNPSQGVMPIIRDMTLLMKNHSGETAAQSADNTNEKTKYERQSDDVKESVLPTASMNLFYQPWGRHLNEVWRRVSNKQLLEGDPGAEEVFAMRERIIKRGVPKEAIFSTTRIMPVRAIGYGSPTSRLMSLENMMGFYGSLDPVGQNNLLRDVFAQQVTYGQVDRYVPRLELGGRMPVDQEIAELQNSAMSAGKPVSVIPNDNHIIHISAHLPSLTDDLSYSEQGQGSPELLSSAQIKAQHIADHMKLLKSDKLNGKIVSELTRQFNNASERVQAATDHAQRENQKQLQQKLAVADQVQAGPSPKAVQEQKDAALRRQILIEDHQLDMRLKAAEATQKMALDDAAEARKVSSTAARDRFRGGNIPVESQPTPPLPAPIPEPTSPPAAGPPTQAIAPVPPASSGPAV